MRRRAGGFRGNASAPRQPLLLSAPCCGNSWCRAACWAAQPSAFSTQSLTWARCAPSIEPPGVPDWRRYIWKGGINARRNEVKTIKQRFISVALASTLCFGITASFFHGRVRRYRCARRARFAHRTVALERLLCAARIPHRGPPPCRHASDRMCCKHVVSPLLRRCTLDPLPHPVPRPNGAALHRSLLLAA